MRTGILTTLIVLFFLFNSLCSHAGWFAPKNNVKIEVGDKTQLKPNSGDEVTEEDFNQILDKVEKILGPYVAEKGGTLVVNRKWSDGTVNAYANRSGKNFMVTMFGGLARHAEATEDAFALVACHEIGHHIGGAPKKRNFGWGRADDDHNHIIFGSGVSWASNEGQSDYWATLKCARRLWENDDNVAIMEERAKEENALRALGKLTYELVPAFVTTKCEASFTDAQEIALCQRSAMGGLALARLLGSLSGGKMPDFDTPDSNVVRKTNDAHPMAQCRLDTYLNGALCDVNFQDAVSTEDANLGTCNRAEGFSVGLRPLCWFKPQAAN
ncbi:MAG: hypothetical protein H6621_01790 [Halobacteriovoraceae bacterium]|nr:hypothetical protein [Halobacteriovoraceae bacterium]MCB9093774.1 hypothetical protein [Halobacteriovoraceae bacterium]